MFEYRYSNMLTVLAVAFLYSGGLPIMYPVAAFSFFFTYWMDKFLLFNCYRKPIKFDNHLAKGTIGYFKYILLGHIAAFLLMYDMTPILQHDLLKAFEQEFELKDEDVYNIFPLYFYGLILLLGLYVVWWFFLK